MVNKLLLITFFYIYISFKRVMFNSNLFYRVWFLVDY